MEMRSILVLHVEEVASSSCDSNGGLAFHQSQKFSIHNLPEGRRVHQRLEVLRLLDDLNVAPECLAKILEDCGILAKAGGLILKSLCHSFNHCPLELRQLEVAGPEVLVLLHQSIVECHLRFEVFQEGLGMTT